MSKKYDIYGIGNALVDIVTEVSDDFLEENNVEKGLMTLIEEDRQNELYNVISSHESNKQCGGSAANSIIAVSQFGGKSFYSCKVANDEQGHFYMSDLRSNGVDSNLTEDNLPEGITGKCLVMTTPDASRTMNTFLGITQTYSVAQLDVEALISSKYLYIEGYLVTSENGVEAMKTAKQLAIENDVKVALTFSDPSMVKYFKSQMEEVVGNGVDLLFCNEEEAMLFTEMDNIVDAREELKKFAKHFAITLGANGATIFDGDTFIDIEPYKVEAIDTNGAGDLFAGAFMFGVTNGHTYAEAGKIASLASSKVVTKYGPRLESQQAKDILNELFDR